MANTSKTLLAKMVADVTALGTINKVSATPFDPDKERSPSAYIAAGSGGSSEDEDGKSSNATGFREQVFVVSFFVKSNEPNDDLLDILDAFTNQVEVKSTGKLYEINDLAGGARVYTVTVNEWEPVRTSEDLRNQASKLTVAVLARYIYRRGSL